MKKERKEQEGCRGKSPAEFKEAVREKIQDNPRHKEKGGPKPQQVELGQMVYIPSLRQKGKVLQNRIIITKILVQAGILKVSLPLSEIRLIDETRKPEHFAKTIEGSLGIGKAVALRSEIDLRGKLVEEAEVLLDKYLDDAVITGINQVSVIHGKGTGALRAGIHQFLKRHPHVAAYRLGEYGEGDSGVTIVELK